MAVPVCGAFSGHLLQSGYGVRDIEVDGREAPKPSRDREKV